jgi:general secretion pathway protein D
MARWSFYQKALAEDPSDPGYQLEVHQSRFQARRCMSLGLKAAQGRKTGGRLLQFEKAYGIDPSSSVAEQEIKTTTQMIERERKKGADSGHTGPDPLPTG